MKNCLAISYQSDTYEIYFTLAGVDTILRYRRSMDCRGEVVDYDDLNPALQRLIYEKLAHELKRVKNKPNGN